MIDAAMSLSSLGHSCTIYTAHHDTSRCFAETIDGSVSVHLVHPLLLPRTILRRLHAALAALRCALVALYVCVFRRRAVDVAVVDLVSLPLLVFWMFGVPTLFYSHFPDALIAASLAPPKGLARRCYRALVDLAEESSLKLASRVACNSQFTAAAFARVYPRLPPPCIIYPCVALPPDEPEPEQEEDKQIDKANDTDTAFETGSDIRRLRERIGEGTPFFVSLNRYERKKNAALAIYALSTYLSSTSSSSSCDSTKLIIAGGFDTRLSENVAVHSELSALADSLNLMDHVLLLVNVPDATRRFLLSAAVACVYTPAHEHFGIVPLEAMALRTPVIACDSGGPRESIVHGVTGMLCGRAAATDFAHAMAVVAQSRTDMGDSARKHVMQHFSVEVLGRELNDTLAQIANADDNSSKQE